MARIPSRNGPGFILSHFLPRRVLGNARDLALDFERERLFKDYVFKRLWFVYPAFILIIAVSCAAGAIALLFFVIPERWIPSALWIVMFSAPIFWFGGVLSQLCLLLSWMEKKALLAAVASENEDQYLGSTHFENAIDRPTLWICLAIFVAVPIVALSLYSVTVAVILMAIWILASIVFTMLEGK